MGGGGLTQRLSVSLSTPRRTAPSHERQGQSEAQEGKAFNFFFSPFVLLGFGVGWPKRAVQAVGWKKVGTPRGFALLILLYAGCHF